MKMQYTRILVALVTCSVTVAQYMAVGDGFRYGPHSCISVTKSKAGSCVISTNCENQDTSHTEFVFNCAKQNGISRHTFGIGTFEDTEEFDSEVKCDRCESSVPVISHHGPPPGVADAAHAASRVQEAPNADVKPLGLKATPSPVVKHFKHELPSLAPAEVHPPSGILKVRRSPSHHHHREVPYKGPQHSNHEQTFVFPRAVQPAQSHPINLRTKHHSREEKTQKSELKTASGSSANASHKSSSLGSLSWPWSNGGNRATDPEKKAHIVNYGPENCVSTYRNHKGECVVRTKCQGVNTTGFIYGLLCVDKAGVPVRHVFGLNSFGPEEIFDTLIHCHKCLGEDNVPAHVLKLPPSTPLGAVRALAKDIEALTGMANNLTGSVNRLNAAVFLKPPPTAPMPAPAPAPAMAEHIKEASSLRQVTPKAQPKAAFLQTKDEYVDVEEDIDEPEEDGEEDQQEASEVEHQVEDDDSQSGSHEDQSEGNDASDARKADSDDESDDVKPPQAEAKETKPVGEDQETTSQYMARTAVGSLAQAARGEANPAQDQEADSDTEDKDDGDDAGEKSDNDDAEEKSDEDSDVVVGPTRKPVPAEAATEELPPQHEEEQQIQQAEAEERESSDEEQESENVDNEDAE